MEVDMVKLILKDDTEIRIAPSNFEFFEMNDVSMSIYQFEKYFYKLYDVDTVKFGLKSNFIYKDEDTGEVVNIFDKLMTSDISNITLSYKDDFTVYYPKFKDRKEDVNDYQVGVRGKKLWVMIGGSKKERKQFLRKYVE